MDLFTSFLICIAMYSIIPVPTIDWTEKKMRFCFCFFPLVGAIIGAVWLAMYQLLTPHLTTSFTAIILLLIPVMLSGGIHLDGLIDSCDAFFSFGDKQKKLDILKDPRTGAFGVQGAIVYFFLLFASYHQIVTNSCLITLIPFVFVISRCVGALSMLCIKNARTNGLGATFSNASDKINLVVLCLWLVAALSALLWINPMMALVLSAVIAIFLLCYLPYINKEFGGITGDLTGFIIAFLECALPFTIAIGGALL